MTATDPEVAMIDQSPRGPLTRLLDRLWPISRRVYYGPNRGSAEYQALGAYVWGCNPCAWRERSVGGYVDTLTGARGKAEQHARQHLFARVVYGEG